MALGLISFSLTSSALFLLFPPLSIQLHSRFLPIFFPTLPSPCSPSPDHCSLQFFVDCFTFAFPFIYSPRPNPCSFSPIPPHVHPSCSFLPFIPHSAPVPIRTASRRRLPHVLPSISYFFPILLSPDHLFVDAVTPSPPCPFSLFLPHTALILNSAPNLHFADRRRCHDDTSTHCSLVGACMDLDFPGC